MYSEYSEKIREFLYEMFKPVFDFLEAADALAEMAAFAESVEAIIKAENSARRRKLERDRARAIEQRYRAEIHRFERDRFCRRIFKPP